MKAENAGSNGDLLMEGCRDFWRQKGIILTKSSNEVCINVKKNIFGPIGDFVNV